MPKKKSKSKKGKAITISMKGETLLGIACFAIAFVLMVFGTTTKSYIFEIGAIILLMLGIVLVGWDYIKKDLTDNTNEEI